MRFAYVVNPVDDDWECRFKGLIFCYLSGTNYWCYVSDIDHPLKLALITNSRRLIKQLDIALLQTITSLVLV